MPEKNWQEEAVRLRHELAEAKQQNAAYEEMIKGNIPQACFWLQTKVWRQRKALDLLNRKVLTQRFRLRTVALMGRDLTKEEYLAAKEQLEEADRVLDYELV